MDAKDIIKWLVSKLPFVFSAATVIVLIIILANVYKLKEAYETGVAIQNECGDEFLERERGDYNVYKVYEEDVKKVLAISFQTLTGLVAFTGVVVMALHLYITFKNYDFAKSSSASIMPFDNKWIKTPIIQRTLHLFVIILTGYITANWIATTFDGADKFKIGGTPLSPLKVSLTSKTAMYSAQVTQLFAFALITSIFVLAPLYNTSIQDKFNGDVLSAMKNSLWTFIGVFTVGIIVTPLISHIILKIRQPINEYESNFQSIGITPSSNISQEVALKTNIYRTYPESGIPGELPGNDDPDLKSYVTHNVNYSDLQAIEIPEQLKPFIHYSSLKGEAVLKLKRDMVAFHNDKNLSTYTIPPDTAKNPSYHTDSRGTVTNSTYDRALRLSLFTHFTPDVRNALLISGERSEVQITTVRTLLDVLNTTVITNTALEKANPFSIETLNKLRQMRENNSIKTGVKSIFNVTTGIIFTILSIMLFILFRLVYTNIPNAGTWVSGTVLLLLFIGIAAGFLTKDTWIT